MTLRFFYHSIWKQLLAQLGKAASSNFMISEVMSLACSHSHWHKNRKRACKRFEQITFLEVSRVSEQCTGIFTVSNALTNMWSKMMEEKEDQEAEF